MTDPHRRRILFVTPFAPRLDGRSGGAKVMAGTIAAIAARHQIGLVYLRGHEEPDPGSLARLFDVVACVDRPRPESATDRLLRKVRLAAGLARGWPLWPGRWRVAGCGEAIRDVALSWQPDIVQFEYHVMGQYAWALDGLPAGRVLVDHDPGAESARQAPSNWRTPSGVAALADRRAWRVYQRRTMQAMDRVVVFTEHDRALLLPDAGSTPVACIPFGVSIPAESREGSDTAVPLLLFVGSFAHHPNEDAARRLIERIFPLVRAVRPATRLTIVGSAPPGWLTRCSADGVEVAGSVADVHPYLDAATIVVAPLRLGCGMRVKVLEAFAAGKAVVASHLAAEGLNVQDGVQLRLASADAEFARVIVELLDSPGTRRELAQRARTWAAGHASWESSSREWEALYTSVLHERRLRHGGTTNIWDRNTAAVRA